MIVYTALFGNIDKLWSAFPPTIAGCKHVCFSERPRRQVGLWTPKGVMYRDSEDMTAVPTWEVRIVPFDKGPRYTARYYKTLPHIHFPDAAATIWVDANVRLLIPPRKAIDEWLGEGVLATFSHPHRKCLFEEAHFCEISKGKGDPQRLRRQVKTYRKECMPLNWGLPETKCVIRPNKPRTNLLNEAWWEELQTHSLRDQISLPYVCWKQGIRWQSIPGRAYYLVDDKVNENFWFTRHGS